MTAGGKITRQTRETELAPNPAINCHVTRLTGHAEVELGWDNIHPSTTIYIMHNKMLKRLPSASSLDKDMLYLGLKNI